MNVSRTEKTRDTWCTPPEILDRVRRVIKRRVERLGIDEVGL